MRKKSGNTTKSGPLVFRLASLVCLFLTLASCANYASRVRQPRQYFEMGVYDAAAEDLKTLVERNDNDQLLYLMDLGLVYPTAGQWEEAVQTFLKAEKLAEVKDYTSLSEESMSVLLSDEVKDYKGEDFEKLLINTYLAMDYALLGKWDDALVECRRVNHKLDMMITQGKLPYEQNAFAKYLAAILFEARHEYNDAFVDYRQVRKWFRNLDFPYLGLALLRMADRLKASQEFEEYKKLYPDTEYRLGKGQGEVVLLLETGKSPIKIPHPDFRLLPKFKRRSYGNHEATLRDRDGSFSARSYLLYDIENTAIRELDHRVSGIIAKKIAGMVVKEAAAYGVQKATNSKLAGFLTSVVLHSSDQADLRSWTTLPSQLHVSRLTLPSGKHDLVLELRGGPVFGGVKRWEGVEVKEGKIQFLNYRLID